MATEKQIGYIKFLYRQLGQEPEDGIENLSVQEASKVIEELKEMYNNYRANEDKWHPGCPSKW